MFFEHVPADGGSGRDNVWFTLLTLTVQAPVHFDAAYASKNGMEKLLVDSTFTLRF